MPTSPTSSTRTKIAAIALAATVALGSGVVLAEPAEAQQDQQQDRQQDRHQNRMERREQRLQALVENGTITQERADEIRARLAAKAAHREERQATRAARLEDLAATLNTTSEELRESLKAGASLADLAATAGVDVTAIIDQIYAQKTARIDIAVAEGRLDQAQADDRLSELRDRITDRVNGERPDPADRPGRGHRGHRGPRGPRGGN